jgi:ABC-type transport system substrate-binding protein
VAAFEAGEVDACDTSCIPPADTLRLKATTEYEQYPALGTYYDVAVAVQAAWAELGIETEIKVQE